MFHIASKIKSGRAKELPEQFCGFSCDDGTLLDWQEYQHPVSGRQKSFADIIRDFASENNLANDELLTSFVIASPEARSLIDQKCYDGAALSDDNWWVEAAIEGLLAIECHSWDHLHPVLPESMLKYGLAEDFFSVDDYEKADIQVRAATDLINTRLSGSNKTVRLFAYPYGHASQYLSHTYFPHFEQEHGIVGAFTTVQGYVDGSSDTYTLPRFVCGDAWNSEAGFEDILNGL